MTEDIQTYLRESGYLDSPTNRLFWKNATPSLRHHMRQWLVLASSACLPIALLIAAVTPSRGIDRWLLAACYLVVGLGAFAVLDVLIGAAMRWRKLEPFWTENRLLNGIPPLGFTILLISGGWFLYPNLTIKAAVPQFLAWIGLALWAYIGGKAIWMLTISRLYWHGIRPPQKQPYPLLMVLALLFIGISTLVQARLRAVPAIPEPLQRQPVVMLTFDVPPALFEDYANLFPDWPMQALPAAQKDITTFWTSFGTGTRAERHRASLVTFAAPLFHNSLNRQESTHRLPLMLMQPFGLLEPLAGSGRYRKYWWEILDQAGLRTFAYAYWHSFPASSRRGGVLTERWTEAHQQPPYLAGMQPTNDTQPPPIHGSENLTGTLAREAQTWAQLKVRAEQRDFDFCIAYFPLADLIDPNHADEDPQSQLLTYRRTHIERLLQRLPQDTRIGIVLASGKTTDTNRRIDVRILTNWLNATASPFEDPLQVAPTLLNYFGLPSDRFMLEPATTDQPLNRHVRLDYGEPLRTFTPEKLTDDAYYEELKSLGYVQ